MNNRYRNPIIFYDDIKYITIAKLQLSSFFSNTISEKVLK